MIRYRTMLKEDIPAGLSLCRKAGWNQCTRDWALFLQLHSKGCRVAEDPDGNVVGTVATVRYGERFSWISMVLVDPEWQQRGIGMQLMHKALEILRNEKTVKLDATPAGREVYMKLNFQDEYPLSRMHINVAPTDLLPATAARKVFQDDVPRLATFDRSIFGADREIILKWMWQGAPQYAFLVMDEKQLRGYCFGRAGHRFIHIGPVAGIDVDAAIQVVTAALQHCLGQPVIIDVPHHTPQWINWLSSIGFTIQRPLFRMYRGVNDWPGLPIKQFAVLGPEFG